MIGWLPENEIVWRRLRNCMILGLPSLAEFRRWERYCGWRADDTPVTGGMRQIGLKGNRTWRFWRTKIMPTI